MSHEFFDMGISTKFKHSPLVSFAFDKNFLGHLNFVHNKHTNQLKETASQINHLLPTPIGTAKSHRPEIPPPIWLPFSGLKP
jgi:hypothetical protein